MIVPERQPVDPRLDSGLAAERTAMAWGRSALGYVGLAALIARGGLHAHVAAVALPISAALLVLAALLGRMGALGYDELGGNTAGVGRRGAIELATAGAVVAALAGTVLVALD